MRFPHSLAVATLLGCASISTPAAAAAAAPRLRPAVVELFTSEGCSSCPPAEAYLGELAQRPTVLALAFHVDYWDDLGWRDRFEVAEAVPRQRLYARALRLASIYTPQVVIDGKHDFVGSDRAAIANSLAQPRDGVAVDLAVQDGDIRIDVGGLRGAGPCDVLLISYRSSAVSAIGRGENAGRTLTEFNIVRSVRSLGTWDGAAKTYHAAQRPLPGDATDIAVLVQSTGQSAIVGAAARTLR